MATRSTLWLLHVKGFSQLYQPWRWRTVRRCRLVREHAVALGRVLSGLVLLSTLGAAAHAQTLDQRFFQVQLLLDQIQLAASSGDAAGVCALSRRANDRLLDILPSLQRQRPGLDHTALQDRILLGFSRCDR